MGKKKKKGKKGITFRLMPRDRNPNSNTPFWWSPDNIESEEEYNKFIGFVGEKNIDMLPVEWVPEDMQIPEEETLTPEQMKTLFGDLMPDGKYDQFEVEEIPDYENKADNVIFEENVKVEKIIVASGKKGRKKEKDKSDDFGVFVEPGFENYESIFEYDGLTRVEKERVLKNTIKNEGTYKRLRENDPELKEVIATLEDEAETADADADWDNWFASIDVQTEPEMEKISYDEWLLQQEAEGLADKEISPEEEARLAELERLENEAIANIDENSLIQKMSPESGEAPVDLLALMQKFGVDDLLEKPLNKKDPTLTEEQKDDEEAFERALREFEDEKMGEMDDEIIGEETGMPVNRYAHLCVNMIEKKSRDWGKPTEKDKETIHTYLLYRKEETVEEAIIEIDKMTHRPERAMWDCQSIVSTYSNLENHPRMIEIGSKKSKKIKLRRGMPVISENKDQIEEEFEMEIDEDLVKSSNSFTSLTTPSKRSKTETKEERKRRKQLVKEQRRLRRIKKKELKTAFKEEKKRFEKQTTALKFSHSKARAL